MQLINWVTKLGSSCIHPHPLSIPSSSSDWSGRVGRAEGVAVILFWSGDYCLPPLSTLPASLGGTNGTYSDCKLTLSLSKGCTFTYTQLCKALWSIKRQHFPFLPNTQTYPRFWVRVVETIDARYAGVDLRHAKILGPTDRIEALIIDVWWHFTTEFAIHS